MAAGRVGQDERMDLTHRFSVPAGMDEAWKAFNNLEELAPCFPGATITSVEGDEFAGSVKIKLGPMPWSTTVWPIRRTQRRSRRVVIQARGKDKRGNGTATATVTARSPKRVSGPRSRYSPTDDHRKAGPVRPGRDLRGQ